MRALDSKYIIFGLFLSTYTSVALLNIVSPCIFPQVFPFRLELPYSCYICITDMFGNLTSEDGLDPNCQFEAFLPSVQTICPGAVVCEFTVGRSKKMDH